MYLLDQLGLFYRPKKQISLPFHILQLVKSLPFHIPEPQKGTLSGEAFPYRSYREYPLPTPPIGAGSSIVAVFTAKAGHVLG